MTCAEAPPRACRRRGTEAEIVNHGETIAVTKRQPSEGNKPKQKPYPQGIQKLSYRINDQIKENSTITPIAPHSRCQKREALVGKHATQHDQRANDHSRGSQKVFGTLNQDSPRQLDSVREKTCNGHKRKDNQRLTCVQRERLHPSQSLGEKIKQRLSGEVREKKVLKTCLCSVCSV